ncbi:MAG: hypothetical protein JXC32_19030 [Anaerolineae bacterium]|nr:hypothetical protein [Anaerolineae bacterium]
MSEPSRRPTILGFVVMQALTTATFVVIGILSGPSLRIFAPLVAMAALGAVVGTLAPVGLAGALVVLYPRAVRSHGWRPVIAAVLRSFFLLIPYAVLAAIARLLLGWNATGAFAAAGLMTACAAVGAEVARLGGNRLTSMLLPMLTGSALSTTWLSLSSLLSQWLLRGAP